MRRFSTSTLLVLCLALAAAQTLGLHHHVEVEDQTSEGHAAHVQHHLSDHHDHESEIDASKLELGNLWMKSTPAIPAQAYPIILAAPTAENHQTLQASDTLHAWRLHWRPPLRAPPLHA